MTDPRISVFGLGKVGHVLAICLAASGFAVTGYDPDETKVAQINSRQPDSHEPGMSERLAKIPPYRLSATNDPAEAIRNSDVTFIIVPTPSNHLGGFSLRYALDAARKIGAALRDKSAPHLVALVSTVLPGASETLILPELERAAGKKVAYAYNPSFIALGEVAKGFEEPDYVLIGADADEAALAPLITAHQRMIRKEGVPIITLRPREAEITKIASNTHETMRVSFANMLMGLCHELGGADVDKITGALSYRLGRRFFKGAVPYGGPCWPRDNQALSALMDAVQVPSLLPRAIDTLNDMHGHYILHRILERTKRGDAIGLVGLAYKPGTSSLERAFGAALAGWLSEEGRVMHAYDPLAQQEARAQFGDRVKLHDSALACMKACAVSIIINPLAELKALKANELSGVSLIDPWRCFDAAQVARANYLGMAQGAGGTMRADERFLNDLRNLCA